MKMDFIIIAILFTITVICCLAQSVIYSRSFKQKNSVMKLDRNTKEWKEFEALFLDKKINYKGYIVVFSKNSDEEELMLHFDCFGTEQDYFKNNYKLVKVFSSILDITRKVIQGDTQVII